MVKVVLVCTNASELKGHPTGLWLEELACPYYLFKEAGFDVIIASPNGGPCPIDKGSMAEAFFTDPGKKFMHDGEAVGHLSHTVKLADVDLVAVDALYMTGGHGTCVDFIDNPVLKAAIESFYISGKVVAADCHGPICLADCVKEDGTPLVQGKQVTGFTDTEEDAVQLTSIVPFLIESRFKEQGALFEKGSDWTSNVSVDGKLVTGQNPQSSEACAMAVIKLLSA
jgi:putative intracellular protease/amidase